MILLKIIFVFLIVYYSIILIIRILAPFLIKRLLKKVQNQNFVYDNNSKSTEGEVKIFTNQKTSTKNISKGDYIDFEEIK